MQTQMIYEMNSTSMVVSGTEIDQSENYRYKMLFSNEIPGIMPLNLRTINGEKKIYINVTGKESLLNFFNFRTATRDDVKQLFEAICVVTEEMSRFLIRESDVILRPEMIYKNLSTGKYEFVCIPLQEQEQSVNEGIKALLRFLMSHLDNADDKLVSAVYQINDMYEKGLTRFSVAYEFFSSETREEEIIEKEEEEREIIVEKKRYKGYRPGPSEIVAAVFCTVGIALIGYNIYLSMIL